MKKSGKAHHKSNILKIIRQNVYSILFITVSIMSAIYILFFSNVFVDDKLILESDFPTFYAAAQIVKDGMGDRLYETGLQSDYQNVALYPVNRGEPRIFKYFPLVTYLFLPLTLLSHNLAFKVFFMLNLFLIFVTIKIGLKIYPNLKKTKIHWLLPLAFYPFSLTMVKGQVSIILLIVFLMVIKNLKINDFRSGMFYSLVLLKPQFFVSGYLFFIIISKDKKGFLKGSALVAVLIYLLSSLISGFDWPGDYINSVMLNNSMHGSVLSDMFSLRNLISRFTTSSTSSYLLLALVFLFTFTVFIKRRNISLNRLIFASVIFTVVLSPHTLIYDLTVVYVALIIIFDKALKETGWASVILFIAVGAMLILPSGSFLGRYELNSLILYLVGISALCFDKRSINLR